MALSCALHLWPALHPLDFTANLGAHLAAPNGPSNTSRFAHNATLVTPTSRRPPASLKRPHLRRAAPYSTCWSSCSSRASSAAHTAPPPLAPCLHAVTPRKPCARSPSNGCTWSAGAGPAGIAHPAPAGSAGGWSVTLRSAKRSCTLPARCSCGEIVAGAGRGRVCVRGRRGGQPVLRWPRDPLGGPHPEGSGGHSRSLRHVGAGMLPAAVLQTCLLLLCLPFRPREGRVMMQQPSPRPPRVTDRLPEGVHLAVLAQRPLSHKRSATKCTLLPPQ